MKLEIPKVKRGQSSTIIDRMEGITTNYPLSQYIIVKTYVKNVLQRDYVRLEDPK